MAGTIPVQAVEGRLFPYAAPRAGHVGWRATHPGEEPEHVIPLRDAQGKPADVSLVRAGVVEVPDTAHYRRGIARGDLERVASLPVAVEPVDHPDLPVTSED